MVSYNRDEFLLIEKNGVAISSEVAKIVDKVADAGYSNIFFVGVGGTFAYATQIVTIIKSRSTLPAYCENAAEFLTTGNKNFTKDSVLVIESVSGDTPEIVSAVEKAHEVGARVIGYVEKAGSPLSKMVDYLVTGYKAGHYFRYAMALRLMYHIGDFPSYDKFYSEMEKFPEALCDAVELIDDRAREYATYYQDAPIQYIVAGGYLEKWGYSFGMCVLEEAQWMRTKSIAASEIFHGTIEVIEKDTCVLLLKGEDAARPLTDRVENFVSRICANLTVLDTKDCELKGISEEFRGLVSPLVMRHMCIRISINFEDIRKHPLETRRYYRQMKY